MKRFVTVRKFGKEPPVGDITERHGRKKMRRNESSNKVIALRKRLEEKRRISSKGMVVDGKNNTRVISITSGKGGVGKTNIVANLGFVLSRLGKKVLILDADLGLGNIDVLLGLTPKFNLSHVISGEKKLEEIMMEGPAGIKILPAASGIQELTRLTEDQSSQILVDLDGTIDSVDVLLIDTAAGISPNVMHFNTTAQEILVVVTPDPTSITDAYALMKVLSLKYSEKSFKLMVNQAANIGEAREVFKQLNLVAERFLDISIEYIGHTLFDDNVTKSVRRQKLVCEFCPDSVASKCIVSLAKGICNSFYKPISKGGGGLFLERFLRNKID